MTTPQTGKHRLSERSCRSGRVENLPAENGGAKVCGHSHPTELKPPAEPLLRLDGVTKRFASPSGPVEVLRDLSLDLNPAEFLMITGPSGAGKSTLLNLVALLDRPSEGRIVFEGRDVSSLTEDSLAEIRKRRIGMVFQRFCLLPHRSLLDNVVFRFRYTSHPAAEARALAGLALEEVGLAAIANRPARLASAGEMQRAAIARAIALKPALLVADEPTGNLDRDNAATVMDCFERIHSHGIAIVMATHNEQLLPRATRHLRCREGGVT